MAPPQNPILPASLLLGLGLSGCDDTGNASDTGSPNAQLLKVIVERGVLPPDVAARLAGQLDGD